MRNITVKKNEEYDYALIHVTAPQGALNKKDQNALISQLSNAVLRSGGADTTDAAAQTLVWGYYSERPTDACYVGGKNLEKAPLTIAVTTPESALRNQDLIKPETVESSGMAV